MEHRAYYYATKPPPPLQTQLDLSSSALKTSGLSPVSDDEEPPQEVLINSTPFTYSVTAPNPRLPLNIPLPPTKAVSETPSHLLSIDQLRKVFPKIANTSTHSYINNQSTSYSQQNSFIEPPFSSNFQPSTNENTNLLISPFNTEIFKSENTSFFNKSEATNIIPLSSTNSNPIDIKINLNQPPIPYGTSFSYLSAPVTSSTANNSNNYSSQQPFLNPSQNVFQISQSQLYPSSENLVQNINHMTKNSISTPNIETPLNNSQYFQNTNTLAPHHLYYDTQHQNYLIPQNFTNSISNNEPKESVINTPSSLGNASLFNQKSQFSTLPMSESASINSTSPNFTVNPTLSTPSEIRYFFRNLSREHLAQELANFPQETINENLDLLLNLLREEFISYPQDKPQKLTMFLFFFLLIKPPPISEHNENGRIIEVLQKRQAHLYERGYNIFLSKIGKELSLISFEKDGYLRCIQFWKDRNIYSKEICDFLQQTLMSRCPSEAIQSLIIHQTDQTCHSPISNLLLKLEPLHELTKFKSEELYELIHKQNAYQAIKDNTKIEGTPTEEFSEQVDSLTRLVKLSCLEIIALNRSLIDTSALLEDNYSEMEKLKIKLDES